MRTLLRIFFHLLYHPLAFTYDFVAWMVSFGHWKEWITEVVPFITGINILELGHGPGHLQRFLLDRNMVAVALDSSPQMGRIARKNTDGKATLVGGIAQQLPFADSTFETVVATFPTEYFFDTQSLSEINRCLSKGGRYIVLPVATPRNGLLKWLYKVTGESPKEGLRLFEERIKMSFENSGFRLDMQTIEKRSGTLVIMIAEKDK